MQVALPDGSIGISDVYLVPHSEANARDLFVMIKTDTNQTIILTPQHFILVADHPRQPMRIRREVQAQDIKPGHYVWVLPSDELVTKLQPSRVAGKFNFCTPVSAHPQSTRITTGAFLFASDGVDSFARLSVNVIHAFGLRLCRFEHGFVGCRGSTG